MHVFETFIKGITLDVCLCDLPSQLKSCFDICPCSSNSLVIPFPAIYYSTVWLYHTFLRHSPYAFDVYALFVLFLIASQVPLLSFYPSTLALSWIQRIFQCLSCLPCTGPCLQTFSTLFLKILSHGTKFGIDCDPSAYLYLAALKEKHKNFLFIRILLLTLGKLRGKC